MKINKDVFVKTKNKLLKINMIVVMCFLSILLTFTMFYFRYITYSNIDKGIGREFKYVVSQLKENSNEPIRLMDPRDMVYIYENGRIKYYTENDYFEKIIPEREIDEKNIFSKFRENGHYFRELNINIGEYHIQIIRNIDSEMFSVSKLISIILFIGIMSLIFIYIISLYLTKKALIPIETAWKNQAKFIQDASHELRTPITIVSSKLELLLKKPNSTIGDEAESIAIAMKETRRLRKMVNDLLSLTKEDGIVHLNKDSFDLNDIVDEIQEDYSDIAEYQEKEFSYEILSENTCVYNDKSKFKQILRIFIDNAFKYTKKNDSINIKIEDDEKLEDTLVVSVNDTGIGISSKDMPNLFDRFFRSDSVRSQDIDGSGIGLSIAEMMSKNIGVDIGVKSEYGKGSSFFIKIEREDLKSNKDNLKIAKADKKIEKE